MNVGEFSRRHPITIGRQEVLFDEVPLIERPLPP